MKYLLDTNICIYFLKGRYDLANRLEKIGTESCFISEITVAELMYGAEKSEKREHNRTTVEDFVEKFSIIPIFNSLRVYAKEKARLSKAGNLVDDFDLLIGASAIANDLTLVTRNTDHFERLQGIKLENWIVE